MRLESTRYMVRGRHEGSQRVAGEAIVLRPGEDANRVARAVGTLRGFPTAADTRAALAGRAERQPIATNQRAAVQAASSRRQVRAAAAEHQRHLDAARDGEVRARAAAPFAETEHCAGREPEPSTPRSGHRRANSSNSAPAIATSARVAESQLRSLERHFERGRAAVVAGERVREPVCERVHRPGHRNADAPGGPTGRGPARWSEARAPALRLRSRQVPLLTRDPIELGAIDRDGNAPSRRP